MNLSRVSIGICSALFMGLLATSLSARAIEDPVCKPILDSMEKVMLTPAHVYMTETAAFRKDGPRNSEMIYSGGANGAIYVMVGGKWTRIRITAGEMLKQEEENRRTTKAACSHIRDESVNGEAAAVYTVHSDTEDAKVEMTVWISKSKSLPLRSEIDMDVGGSDGKSQKQMRYDYANVRPPAGVQ